MSQTTLSPETLALLHAEAQAGQSRFVNPYIIARCQRLLEHRGEAWAESVLLRRLDQRSLISPQWPWLRNGESEILVLADEAEWQQLIGGVSA